MAVLIASTNYPDQVALVRSQPWVDVDLVEVGSELAAAEWLAARLDPLDRAELRQLLAELDTPPRLTGGPRP